MAQSPKTETLSSKHMKNMARPARARQFGLEGEGQAGAGAHVRGVAQRAVAARQFGAVHGHVGATQQGVRGFRRSDTPPSRCWPSAGKCPRPPASPAHAAGSAAPGPRPARQRSPCPAATPQTRRRPCGRPCPRCAPLAAGAQDGAQQNVTHLMAQVVVDLLKWSRSMNNKENGTDCCRRAWATSTLSVVEQVAVGQAGQAVIGGLALQRQLRFMQLGHVTAGRCRAGPGRVHHTPR